MAGTALRRRLIWQHAEVLAVRAETARACRLTLDPPDWPGHVAGQHLDLRLSTEDGYTAQCNYSIASLQQGHLELVIERLGGDISTYLTKVLRPGDLLEPCGPIWGYFVWPDRTDDDVQLIAGGSGVVPFLAMLGHHRAVASPAKVRLLYSARTAENIIGRDVLDHPPAGMTIRSLSPAPPQQGGPGRRAGSAPPCWPNTPSHRRNARTCWCAGQPASWRSSPATSWLSSTPVNGSRRTGWGRREVNDDS